MALSADRGKPVKSPRAGFDRAQARAALSVLFRAARPERKHLVWGSLWLGIAAALGAATPILSKRYIDQYLLPGHYDLEAMAGLLAAVLLTGWGSSWIRYAQLLRMAGIARRSVLRLRQRSYAHVLSLPMAFFDKAITGQLVSRVTNDTEAVDQLYRQVLYVMLDSCIVLVGSLVAMAILDWRLMLIVATLAPAMVVIIALYQRLSASAVARTRELRSVINAHMAEGVTGMAVIQAAGATARFRERYEAINTEHRLSRIVQLRANAWLLRPALDLLNVLLLVGVLHSFGRRELSGQEVGLLYAFLAYIARVVEPLLQITTQFSQLQQAMVAASRVQALLQEGEATRPSEGDASIREGSLRIEDVSFGYDPARPVLQNIDVDFPAGSFTGIVGHTGSGKSTLLSLLLRFYTPTEGNITVDGQPLAAVPDTAFRDAVGVVPQEPFLLSASVQENIAMGRPGISGEAARAAAQSARAHDFIEALPEGYGALLGEGGARVSSGQKQLLAMARALAGAPRILFLDEATSNVDSETEASISAALAALHGRVTVVAIAHRLSTIRAADQILVLTHGRIEERGTHDALMAKPGGLYRRLVELETLEEREKNVIDQR
jgi:ATP-binding cassette subfamily B multidrug efflux pump